jgi:TetR/AcrR family transcriptional regulator, acrAB operon repressor
MARGAVRGRRGGKLARRRAPGVSRDAILDAALRCFAKRGYHETSVDDIAARARLSKGAIYWHFAGKRELFLALIDRFASDASPLLESVRDAPDWRTGLHRLFGGIAAYLDEGLPLFKLSLEFIAQGGRDPEVRALFESSQRKLAEVAQAQIARGVEEGTLRPVSASAVALIIDALNDGLLLAKLISPDLDLEPIWRQAEEILWRGMSA